MEQDYLDRCWKSCRENEIRIPATKIKDQNNKWQRSIACCVLNEEPPTLVSETEMNGNYHDHLQDINMLASESNTHEVEDIEDNVESDEQEVEDLDTNVEVEVNAETIDHDDDEMVVNVDTTDGSVEQQFIQEVVSLPVQTNQPGSKRPSPHQESHGTASECKKKKTTDQSDELSSKTARETGSWKM
jgi:hypothetical protein